MLKLLSIETGDDEEDRPEIKAASKKSVARAAADTLTKEQQFKVQQTLSTVIDCFEAEMVGEALDAMDEAGLEVEEKLAIWAELDSKQRSAIKKEQASRKEASKQPA